LLCQQSFVLPQDISILSENKKSTLMKHNEKFEKLSPELQMLIQGQHAFSSFNPYEGNGLSFTKSNQPVSDFAANMLLHCNAGTAMESAFWLRDHLNKGGKLMVTIAGALSSFQIGKILAPLIRAGKVHIISATGANHEEDYYRYVAFSHYAHIPRYTELSPQQEAELRDAGYRRITDTFLPEDESVRELLPHLEKMWEKAEEDKERYFPHEYFRRLYSEGLAVPDIESRSEAIAKQTSWTYAAYSRNIPIIIPGFEDSTMGNIFAGTTYTGQHQTMPVKWSHNVMKNGIEYMHYMYDWYQENATGEGIAFLQLGGGIAADFPICVVPSLKHDLQLHDVMDWKGFIEIGSSPMSYGSYSGAGGKEKITWDKLSVDSKYAIIQSDATLVAPLMIAIIMGL